MKKRIFTLLALGMLIGGISSTLKAQVNLANVSMDRGYDNGVYEKKAKSDAKSSKTTLKVTLTGLPLTTGSDTTIYFEYNDVAAYLGLPKSIKLSGLDTITSVTSKQFEISVEKNWGMPNTVNGSEGTITASFNKSFPVGSTVTFTAKYYNYPTFTVDYRATTAQYEGVLRISDISGGHPDYNDYMNRTLKKDYNYGYITVDTVLAPFSDIEVASLTYGDKVVVTTAWETYYLDIPGLVDPSTPGLLTRPITVPVVNNALLNIESGVIQAVSGVDFIFTITPTGSNTGLVPEVTTGRTGIPDSEGVLYKQLSDGSWLVTIKRVTSPINLSIGFTTSNASIENNSVWATGNQLYINAPVSGTASIYSITGALVKTVVYAAGETANVSLSTGLYVVTVNGKAYKVTVK